MCSINCLNLLGDSFRGPFDSERSQVLLQHSNEPLRQPWQLVLRGQDHRLAGWVSHQNRLGSKERESSGNNVEPCPAIPITDENVTF